MYVRALVVCLFCTLPGLLPAQPYVVTSSFRGPARTCQGIAFDGRLLWTADMRTKQIFGLSPRDGTPEVVHHVDMAFPSGITFDGEYLRVLDVRAREVVVVDPETGAIKERRRAPVALPTGIQRVGGHDWLVDSKGEGLLAEVDFSSSVISQIPAPGPRPYGLAFDGTDLWVSNNHPGGQATLFRIDPRTGTVLQSFPCPGDNGAANGLEVVDGKLWVLGTSQRTFYELELRSGAGER